jgi:hypothetical protein
MDCEWLSTKCNLGMTPICYDKMLIRSDCKYKLHNVKFVVFSKWLYC